MKTLLVRAVKGFAFLILFNLFAAIAHAQSGPPMPTLPSGELLNVWRFADTNWLTWRGEYAPLSFTNIDDVSSWDGNALQVDSDDLAWLKYSVVETNGYTNLVCDSGTIEFWFIPNWQSDDTNYFGTGPGDWARLIDVGMWTSNATCSWWSLYLNPAGTTINFASQTNGVGTNYISYPFSWDGNTWHLIALTYSPTNTALYIDGALATNGAGVIYPPGEDALTNGFYIGSDVTGTQQAHGQFDDLMTFSYELGAYDIADDYAYFFPELPTTGGGGFFSPDFFPPSGGYLGGGGSNTNLWLYIAGVSNNLAGVFLLNTMPDVLYEIQSTTNLAQLSEFGWGSEGFVYGPETTNYVEMDIPQNNRPNLFMRIRSWIDSNDSGIPDWWWLAYFGQVTNVDATASVAGDGYSNLQKFQLGLNPTNYYNPNALADFAGCLDATGTNVFLEWDASPGPVTYSIQRGIEDTNGNYTFTQIGEVNSNATFYEDVGVNTNANSQNNIYNIEAIYPETGVVTTNTWTVWWYVQDGIYGPSSGPLTPNNVYASADVTGTNVLISWTPIQSSATNYLIERGVDNTNTYSYDFFPVALAGPNATNFEVVGAITNGNNWNDEYSVAAVYPGGGLSQLNISPINPAPTTGAAAPTGLYGYADGTGTNLYLGWNLSSGAVSYLIFGVGYSWDAQNTVFIPLGKVGASTNLFESIGAIIDSYGDTFYSDYEVVAVYSDGSLSQPADWSANYGLSAPSGLKANIDAAGTNVVLSWTPALGATGYIIKRSDYSNYYYYQIGSAGAGTLSFMNTNEVNIAPYGVNAISYEVQATFPHSGLSSGVFANVSTNLPAPNNLSVTTDATNAFLSWSPPPEAVSNYVILRGIYNPLNGTYAYSQIGTVGSGTTTFEDANAITSQNSYNNNYEVEAEFPNGDFSAPDDQALYSSAPQPSNINPNLNVTAQLVRNEKGRWQLMFSAIPTNVQSIALSWEAWDYFYDLGPETLSSGLGYPFNGVTYIPVSSLTNGAYVLPDSMTVPVVATGLPGVGDIGGFELTPGGNVVMIQPVETNNVYGNSTMVGFLPYDEPAFADGRTELKQNLLYELRAATITQTGLPIYTPAGTNYAETSFFHFSSMDKGYNSGYVTFTAIDDLWPFNLNYQLHSGLYDPNYTGASSFQWTGSLTSAPAPAVLGISDPYWISQGLGNPADLGASTNSGIFSLASGAHNLFGLAFETALVNQGGTNYGVYPPQYNPPITNAPGSSTAMTNVNCLFSQTADPSLSLVNYYFAPVNTPGTDISSETSPVQPYPIPPASGFSTTNQTGIMITSIGTPTVIGGWAKFSISGSSKYAYLGQYYVTNAFVVTNGVVSTNKTGVVSPYGNFFPTQPGQVAMITMPDIDTGAQGTCVVDVVSINVDANHDGTMDFTYGGPDFVSSSKPFRFWVNDDQDSGDYGGDGIPGLIFPQADGQNPAAMDYSRDQYFYKIRGTRDLVDYFPVYLNIGSLFQSNALSAGISFTDTNYQFVLSQADGALRFAYTTLTPTNYMNFLRDTNEARALGGASDATFGGALVTTINNLLNGGVVLSQSFLSGIATNNQGIILVEAWTNTTQPLVLTIYRGTNQIAQTSLYLSISGVEQMFRHKNLLLNIPPAMPDRLTDASVPNEPDTIDKNFVFVHGYNVNPQQARGWDADIYKRLYWSGSHAKFYGVTWEAADSQKYNQVTINLQTNIVNAFNTAPLLNSFLNSLVGTNVVAAHSLGNMLVLSTLNDYTNQSINSYFMIDAAVAINAIDTGAGSNPDMYPSAWTNYSGNLWASDWYGLFPTNDYRSGLTWWGRLANFQNASVYNFYSSGEEVLRDYPTDPPDNLPGIAVDQLVSLWKGDTGEYTWAWQEKLKGLMPANGLLSSDHGGWQLNEAYETNIIVGGSSYWEPMSPTAAAALTTTQLKTNAFFSLATQTGFVLFTNDLALESSSGSSYAQANRNRILSDAIPCLTLPVGANLVPRLQPPESPFQMNFDMQASYENGWPAGRPPRTAGVSAEGEWHHSDIRAVAYTFTYKVFNEIVNDGNLK